MKKVLPAFLFMICASYYATSQSSISENSTPASKVQELIIYMPHVDKLKTLQAVINMVESTKYIKPVAFCDDLKCLLLRVEGDHPEKSDRLLQDFKIAGFDFAIKSNASIQKVLNQSHDILNTENNWQ